MAYYKLGPKAHIFFDAGANLKITKDKIVQHTGKLTKKMKVAIGNGHIIEVDEPDEDGLPDFSEMSAEEIVSWTKENIENLEDKLSEDEDLSSYKKQKLIKRVKELLK